MTVVGQGILINIFDKLMGHTSKECYVPDTMVPPMIYLLTKNN